VRRLVLAAALALACRAPAAMTIHYPHRTETFLNPERGFMVDLDLARGRDFSSVRAGGHTLAYAGVRLDDFRSTALPASFLDDLRAGFAAVRAAGIKVVLRFVYNHAADGADAPKEQILVHVAQLQPVLQENADVIAVMDAGFIGAWGEWHSSTHGLDNLRDRGDVLYAILAALPASRSVTVRSPLYKADAYGDPLPEGRAFDGSHPARVGHHNSCFLASDTDLGTYGLPIDRWKDYVAHEGRFTPVGGETCQLNPPRTDCETAVAELARLHWSFLNALYHEQVLETWRAQGCLDEIARDLGYRFEVRWASFDEQPVAGGVLHLTVRIENTGYAAMFNARPVHVVIDDLRFETDLDPRTWEPGEVTLRIAVPLPADLAPGRHRLGLWLPDADPRLRTPELDPLYAVRLAGTVWDDGINVLTEELVVSALP
jgi:hypothetical protein